MKHSTLILLTLIATIVVDIFRYLSYSGDLNVGFSTYIASLFNYFSIVVFIIVAVKSTKKTIPKTIFKLIIAWLIICIINLFRGLVLASDYWDYKFLFLNSVPFTFVTLSFYVGLNPLYVHKLFKWVVKYLFKFGFLLIPYGYLTNPELYARIMLPIYILILFIPYVKMRTKIIIGIVTLVSVLSIISFRSNVLRASLSVLILGFVYYTAFGKEFWLKVAHKIIFSLPLIFFIIVIFWNYNVFSEISKNENFIFTNEYDKEESFVVDNRTFLYVEVFSSLEKSNNWIFGEGLSGSYHSDFFKDEGGAIGNKRYRSEINILNILLYQGIVGVMLYFFILYKVSQYAIFKSANYLSKMIGLFIALRWPLGFIEEFTQFDLNFYFIWIIIGLVSLESFRQLTNEQVRNFYKKL